MDKAEFDKFAAEYRAIHEQNIKISGESPEFFAEYKIADVKKLADRHSITDNCQILDFGCGVGGSIPFLVKYFPQAEITGIDVSEQSLKIAQEQADEQREKLKTGVVNFKLFDGERIPFPDNSFDIVFTACVFHHIPHTKHVDLFREIYRVTRQGGFFINFEHNPYNPLTVNAVNNCVFDENAVLIRPGAMKKRFREAKFSNPDLCYRIFFPSFLKVFRGLEKFLKFLPVGAQYYLASVKE